MKTIDQYPYVMTASQLADFLGVAASTAYEYMRHTDFPTIKLNHSKKGAVRVKRDDVMDWLEKQKRQGA